MFDIIQKIGKNNWVFGTYYKYKNLWKVSFTKNIHGDIEFVLYDDLFIEMEKRSFSSKQNLNNYCLRNIKREINIK